MGTFAKWLLGSRKAEGKCCLGLFDLCRAPPPHSAAVEAGVGSCTVGSRFLCPLPIVLGTDATLSLPPSLFPLASLCPHLLTGARAHPLRKTRLW